MNEIKLSDGTAVSAADAERIYRIVDRDYRKQDVIAKICEEYGNDVANTMEADDDLIDTLANRFEDSLAKNDSYFESMWESMYNVLKEFFKDEAEDEDATETED